MGKGTKGKLMKYLLIFLIAFSAYGATYKQRWEGLHDKAHAFYTVFPDVPNKKFWFYKTFAKMTGSQKEIMMSSLESKDSELEIVREGWRQKELKWKQSRQRIKNLDAAEIAAISNPILRDVVIVLQGRR